MTAGAAPTGEWFLSNQPPIRQSTQVEGYGICSACPTTLSSEITALLRALPGRRVLAEFRRSTRSNRHASRSSAVLAALGASFSCDQLDGMAKPSEVIQAGGDDRSLQVLGEYGHHRAGPSLITA